MSASTPPPTPLPPQTFVDRIALLLGDWFGCGRAPLAPGTVGALGALPFYYFLREVPLLVYVGACLAISVIGIFASDRSAQLLGDDDPSRVVIDEVAGVWIALGFVRGGLPYEILAWILFRLLDIKKPGPIDRVQYLEPNGLGIMADDVLAGLGAGALALCAQLLVTQIL